MAYKEIVSLDADRVVKIGGTDRKTGKTNPTECEGYYLGTRKVEGNKGECSIHFFLTNKGNLGVWGTTNLDKKMGTAKVGQMTKITYSGMKPTPKGEMHTYRVQQDPDNVIEVDAQSSNQQEDTSFDDSDDNFAYPKQDDNWNSRSRVNEVIEDEVPRVTASKKAHVENLLKGKK